MAWYNLFGNGSEKNVDLYCGNPNCKAKDSKIEDKHLVRDEEFTYHMKCLPSNSEFRPLVRKEALELLEKGELQQPKDITSKVTQN